jgi:three-Cys-motif partner protein
MAKDINQEIFPEETLLKLNIFAECFREWFPVFLHSPFAQGIHIFDFFAGSGKDKAGNKGSPLILLDEAKGNDRQYCDANTNNAGTKHVVFHFNESDTRKVEKLRASVSQFLGECARLNCKKTCRYSDAKITGTDFRDGFSEAGFQAILKNNKMAKFILLDQYGFSQVDENTFNDLVSSPMTDFIFFISSSFIRRFKDRPVTKKYFETHKIPFNEKEPDKCHRQIADYYQSLVPANLEYYIHNFTIKKGSNYWGLIFGSSHTLGMEKFLKVCWGQDVNSGESNFNIDGDWGEDTPLFYVEGQSNKRQKIRDKIRKEILCGRIQDNLSGLKFALANRCLPSLFIEVVKVLEKEGSVTLVCADGKPSYAATNIHKVKSFHIKLPGGQT